MKKLNFFLASLLFAVATQSSVFAIKAAIVDAQRVLLSVKEGQRMQRRLEKNLNERRKKVQKEQAAFERERQKFDQKRVLMTEKDRVKRERELYKKVAGLQEASAKYQRELWKKEEKEKAPILKRMATIIQEMGKQGGYDFVFEFASRPAYSKKPFEDITDKVIAAYDKKFK